MPEDKELEGTLLGERIISVCHRNDHLSLKLESGVMVGLPLSPKPITIARFVDDREAPRRRPN